MLLKKGSIVTVTHREIYDDEEEPVVVFEPGDLIKNPDVFPSMKIVKKGEVYDSRMGYSRLYLHLIIVEDSEKGDLILGNSQYLISKVGEHGCKDAKKIIASTDLTLNIPGLSDRFLQVFVKNNGINEVLVIYEESNSKLFPKINKYNRVCLGRFKSNHTGEEVADLMKLLIRDVYEDMHKELALEWIDEHV